MSTSTDATRLVVGTCPSERWGPDPRNQPLGCGVTGTDWRANCNFESTRLQHRAVSN